MSDSQEFSALRVLKVLLVLVTVAFALFPYAISLGVDPDLWWHIRSGLLILERGAIPMSDPFSYTGHQDLWVNHEWLFQIVAGWFYNAGDVSGLLLLRLILMLSVFALFLVLGLLNWRHPTLLLAACCFFVFEIIAYYSILRPRIITCLLFLLTLLCIELYRRGWRRSVWLFPAIMLVWVNSHGGFMFGVGLMGLAVLSLYYDRDGLGEQPTPGERRSLLVTLGLTIAATFCTPYGVDLFIYVFSEVSASHQNITEWQGPRARQTVHFIFFIVLPLVLVVLTKMWRYRTLAIVHVICAIMAVSFNRFFILLVLAASLITFAAVEPFWKRFIEKDPYPWYNRLRSSAFIIVIAFYLFLKAYLAAVKMQGVPSGIIIDRKKFPVSAAEFLRKQDYGEKLATPYNWGGYLIWSLWPQYKVSIDSRYITVYEHDYANTTIKAYFDGDIEKFQGGVKADVVLTTTGKKLYENLTMSPDWQKVYEDPVASVFAPAS